MSFFEELKRRNVVRVRTACAVGAWVLLQIFDVIGEILDLPPQSGMPKTGKSVPATSVRSHARARQAIAT